MGLYDPLRDERDACGIGFVADARGRASRWIVDSALEALCRVRHRGAVAADAKSGDGSGLLLPIPRGVIAADERHGVAMCFFRGDVASARRMVEEACRTEELQVVEWRSVPVDDAALGDSARASAPVIEQAILSRPLGSDVEDAERRAFRARRRVERAARDAGASIYIASLSFRTVTYKALSAADQLAEFYRDLSDGATEAWFAIFHQRYSTNTAPTWERAQPFRFLGHNGEINTIRGNIAWMRSREGHLGSEDLAPEDLLAPAIDRRGSDSQILDEALELIVRGGRDLRHAAAMLVPSAWERVLDTDPEVADFFHYHSCLIEPWDGPSGLVFSDGVRVAAALDRNGLRPLRVAICDDGLVAVASEAGAVSTRGHGRVTRTKIGPGEAFCVDPSEGVLLDAEIRSRLARRRPYGDWIAEHLVRPSRGVPHTERRDDLVRRQVAAGYSKEEFTVVLRPMATEGAEPTSSMGDDTAQPPLAEYGRPVFSFLKQRFAQVTNPPIDHLRERHVMSISTRVGGRAPLLQEHPEGAALREYDSPLLFASAIDDLEAAGALVLDATFSILDGPEGLEAACRRLADEAEDASKGSIDCVIVASRDVDEERAPIPSALAAGAVHHRLVATGRRSSTSIVVD
ncbi:MAG: glutamate synthase central domain-containing protein, partial [Actinomycetota bacterium]